MKLAVVLLLSVLITGGLAAQGGWLKWLLGKTVSPFDDGKLKELEQHTATTDEPNEPAPRSSESTVNEDTLTDKLASIPFELTSTDEKFLVDARKYTDLALSELDMCQHRAILQIRTECSDLSEEDLSKLGVNLLNCQSALEGRRIYPCTSAMSIRECTAQMDPDTWNAYHIMSNRARAVCYAARQQQFRALTQMAVNKLMMSSAEQLGFLKTLKKEQEDLGLMASQTLGSLTAGQQQLLEQQDYLRASQLQASQQLSSTLSQLSRERAAALSSQRELSDLAELVKKTLDESSRSALEQREETAAAQRSLLGSFGHVEQRMGESWRLIESSFEQLLSQQQRSAVLQSEALETLSRLNSTVSFLLNVAERSKKQLDWTYELVASVDSKVGGLSIWLLHGCYFLSGMLILSFLQAPPFTRLAFLALLPLNLAVQLQQGAGLDAAGLSVFLAVSTAAYLLLRLLVKKILDYANLEDSPKAITPAEKSAIRLMETMEEVEVLNESFAQDSEASLLNESLSMSKLHSSRSSTPLPSMGLHQFEQPSITSVLLEKLNDSSSTARRRSSRLENSLTTPRKEFAPTPSLSLSMNSTRSGTPRRQCHGFTLEGKPCKNSSLKDSPFCRVHNK